MKNWNLSDCISVLENAANDPLNPNRLPVIATIAELHVQVQSVQEQARTARSLENIDKHLSFLIRMQTSRAEWKSGEAGPSFPDGIRSDMPPGWESR